MKKIRNFLGFKQILVIYSDIIPSSEKLNTISETFNADFCFHIESEYRFEVKFYYTWL
jgi:hypothetical protein